MFAHLAAFVFFVVTSLAFLARLLPVWSTYIPGGQQDTRFLLWNDWWFHRAIDVLHTNPFHTPLLFHPFGTSLVLTDSPLWNSLVTYLGQHFGIGLIASANVSFILSWILAGFATYLLTWEITQKRGPSLIAGILVMTHSFTLSCTLQNWSRFNLYGIALFLWALVRARRRKSVRSFIAAGIALAWTAACHYYFLVYSLLLWFVVFVADYCPIGFRLSRAPAGRAWGKAGLGIAALGGAIAAWIGFGHPADLHIGSTVIGLETPFNALIVMWMGLFLWLASHWSAQIYRRDLVTSPPLVPWTRHAALVGTAFVCLLPLLTPIASMVIHGEYPRQSILWKTHRTGANLFSLFMPNPLQIFWGPAVNRWFTSRGLIVQDQAASIGWVFMGLLAITRPWKWNGPIKRWLALGAGTTILALGPYLHLAQWNLWMPLPFYFLRLLPVAGNTRVPNHWMAVASTAWAVVFALVLTRLAEERKWSLHVLSLVVGALVLFENWPGIPIAPKAPLSPIYERLRTEPPGGVLTVPLFVGDSSIGVGDSINGEFIFPWDHLWAQLGHEKPIVGGYIGRISHHMIEHYKEDPFIHRLLDLEDDKTLVSEPEPAYGEYSVKNMNFRYVLLYPQATDSRVVKYALGSLPIKLVEKNAGIELYRIREESLRRE